MQCIDENAKTRVERTNLERVFIALILAKLTNHAIELVLTGESVTFFLPFIDSDDCAAFWIDEAQKPTSQCIATAAGAGGGDASSCWLCREVASGGGEIASDGTQRHFGFGEVSSELRDKRFVQK